MLPPAATWGGLLREHHSGEKKRISGPRPDEAELGSIGKKGSHRLKRGFLSKRNALEKNNSHPSVNVDFSGSAMLKCLSCTCARDFSGSQIISQRAC